MGETATRLAARRLQRLHPADSACASAFPMAIPVTKGREWTT